MQIVVVKFENTAKQTCFENNSEDLKVGDRVIVTFLNSLEAGTVTSIKDEYNGEEELLPVIRKATPADCRQIEKNKDKEAQAFEICKEKIKQCGLEMHLIAAHYTFDRSKALFYFAADGRVDFRGLVKLLASALKTRIELRQVGVRDEARMMGGIGVCGRALCCSSFLSDFTPVSIKMSREQSLSLNPSKISGNCGRLMCCLKYEQEMYDELLRYFPKVGSVVMCDAGEGVVLEVFLFKDLVKVKINSDSSVVFLSPKKLTVIRQCDDDDEAADEIEELKYLE